MNDLLRAMFPEIVLCAVACVLLLMGVSMKAATRRAAPVLAILALLVAGASQLSMIGGSAPRLDLRWNSVRIYEFARYVKLLSSAIGVLLVLLAWPSNSDATGGPAHHFGTEAAEFFGLMLLSIAGIFLVAGANDIMLLFLGIELASIPTYIMVSISAPRAIAQEAGVKYFFLGAMAAALMLFGFSYLFGTTGTTRLDLIAQRINPITGLTSWQLLAVVLLIVGFAFKMAVVPLHFYAGDVYQGAATPVTAFLSFVPKISGFVALLKVLFAVTAGTWHIAPQIVKLLWVLAVLTMSVGNVLGLVQVNIKRLFAYSSIAHSGYMLVGVTALISTTNYEVQSTALQGILFYLTAYGLMNVAAFGVLILLPGRLNQPFTSAETFDDIAGAGREHTLLGLAMAVSCFSLIGIPLTIGFFGKFFLILPAWKANLTWLVVILVINAAVSAGYYLRIVGSMFLSTETPGPRFRQQPASDKPVHHPMPVLVSVGISMAAVLWFGIVFPATSRLVTRAATAAHIEPAVNSPVAAVSQR
ncbi:MAG TPA: NADH-quinone oxidoreductase subunit N [Tepidisphaeraceae bacterium]|jgi:NADH-quinone oxidoreductase subunit N|nr:NADH-quinone oxidoreductase subunit N [Tepidisphaeraceae bacterium]